MYEQLIFLAQVTAGCVAFLILCDWVYCRLDLVHAADRASDAEKRHAQVGIEAHRLALRCRELDGVAAGLRAALERACEDLPIDSQAVQLAVRELEWAGKVLGPPATRRKSAPSA